MEAVASFSAGSAFHPSVGCFDLGTRRRLGVGGWLLVLYLGTAPVYWLPGVGPDQMMLLKFVLVALSTGIIWSKAFIRGDRLLPSGLFGVWGLVAVIVAAAPGFFQAEDMSAIVDNAVDLVLGFIVLWTLFILVHSGIDVGRFLMATAGILAILATPSFLSWLIGVPAMVNPWGYPLSFGGFGAKRTGWSVALSLYTPILLIFPLLTAKRPKALIAVSLVLVTLVLGSQFASAGRAGMLGSLVGMAIVAWLLFPRRYAVLLLVAMTILVTAGVENYEQHLRFDRLTGTDIQALDRFSANRFTAFLHSFDMFAARPLTGYGFDLGREVMSQKYGYWMEVHNVWLRLLLDAGPILPGLLLVLVFLVVREAFRTVPRGILTQLRRRALRMNAVVREDAVVIAALGTLASGLVVSQFEPNALVGSFQNEVLWWACAGVVVGIAELRRSRRSCRDGGAHRSPGYY